MDETTNSLKIAGGNGTPILKDSIPSDTKPVRTGYVHTSLKNALTKLKAFREDGNDVCMNIWGAEGSGKTTVAFQIASYCDPEFSLNKVAWNIPDCISLIEKSKPGDCIVFDEAFSSTGARALSKKENQMFYDLMTRIREFGIYFLFVSPRFHELDRYFAVDRTVAGINVYRKNGERGHLMYFNKLQKQQLYVQGKKKPGFVMQPLFFSHFGDWMPVSKEEYVALKRASIFRQIKGPTEQKVDRSRFTTLKYPPELMEEAMRLSLPKFMEALKRRGVDDYKFLAKLNDAATEAAEMHKQTYYKLKKIVENEGTYAKTSSPGGVVLT